jgi:hypothetical protein
MQSPFRPSSILSAVIPNVSPLDYHKPDQYPRGDARRTMSRSELSEFHRCPRKWLSNTREESTDATEWGSLIDCLVLTPERFAEDYAIAPETYKAKETAKKDAPLIDKPWNWNATECKEWRKARESEGKIVIKASESSEAHLAVHRLKEDETIFELLSVSETQVQINVEYEDPETGLIIPIKCLLDLRPMAVSVFGSILADLKTTNDAEPHAWSSHVFKYGLHTQAALYLDATNAATGLNYTDFAHIVQESSPPYETARRMLDAEYLQIGRATYLRQLVDYCACLKYNHFPGYDDWKGNTQDGWRIVSPQPWMILSES